MTSLDDMRELFSHAPKVERRAVTIEELVEAEREAMCSPDFDPKVEIEHVASPEEIARLIENERRSAPPEIKAEMRTERPRKRPKSR